jgi:RNA polymerase sigma-70 factor (ECF subfamily)
MRKLRQNCDETAEFVQKFKSGDNEAFNDFCTTHRYIAKAAVKGRCRPEDIDDLVQEALMKAFKHRSRYDPSKSKLSTWLSRIATSLAIDLYRLNKNRTSSQAIEDTFHAKTCECKNEGFNKLMSRLSEDEAVLLRLKFVEEMRCEDIANALDMQIGTVKSNLFRLKKKIAGWSSNAR